MTEETFTPSCVRFAAGSAVPEWLVAVEPIDASSVPGPFIFQSEVDVIETEDRFIVLATETGNLPPTFHYGGRGGRAYAASKPVCNILAHNQIEPLDVNAWVQTGNDMVQAPAWLTPSPYPQDARSQQHPLAGSSYDGVEVHRPPLGAQPSFWRRLWNAIGGV